MATTLPSIDREEKLSPAKLHAMQYVIVVILGVLVVGLWNLQVLDAASYTSLAEANRIRKDAGAGAAGTDLRSRRPAIGRQLYLRPRATCMRDQVKDPGV